MIETRRHHADDLHILPVQSKRATKNVRIAAKAPHPKTVAEDDDGAGADPFGGLMIFGNEDTPQRRLSAQRREEVRRGDERLYALGRRPRLGQVWATKGVGDQLLEDVVLLALSEEVPRRMRPALRMYRSAKHPHEPVRIRIRQRAKQIGVEHAEHRRVGPDPESQRERGHYGEAFVFDQHSQADAEVLKHFALQYLWF